MLGKASNINYYSANYDNVYAYMYINEALPHGDQGLMDSGVCL